MQNKMRSLLLLCAILLIKTGLQAQPLQLLDRFNGNKVVNDSVVKVFSSDTGIPELTQYFTMKNNTDRPLALFLRKTVLQMSDSTTDYFCFGVKCWPNTDTTDIADTIQPGAEDYTFATHVTHVRRFDIPQPPLPPGKSVITYTIYDHTAFPEPVEASVTVVYHLSSLGVQDPPGYRADVYPNPASDKVNIRCTLEKTGPFTVYIYSSAGILASKASGDLIDGSVSVSTSGLPAGLYFGLLVTGSGTSPFQVVIGQ
jgi:hypothetical protein